MANGDPQYFQYLNTNYEFGIDYGNGAIITTMPYTMPYKSSITSTKTVNSFNKIHPYEYHQITYGLIDSVVNFRLKLNIVDYDQFTHQTLAYSLEFDYMPYDEPLYFECFLNDIENYDIVEINPIDSRYLTFGYVKCEVVGITGFTLADRILLKILDKKDLE